MRSEQDVSCFFQASVSRCTPPPPHHKTTHTHAHTHPHTPTLSKPLSSKFIFVVAPKLLMVNPRQILNPLHPPPPPPPRAPQTPLAAPQPHKLWTLPGHITGILYVSNLTDCQWYEENFGRRDFLSDRKLNAWRFDFNIERCIVTDFRVFEILSRFRWCI